MGRELYNFIWAPPPPPNKTVRVSHVENNTVSLPPPPAKGVILFPSLLTPLVHVEDEPYFELLIACDKDLSKLPYLVNEQLKIGLGLDPTKPYDKKALFGGVDGKNIVCKRVGGTMAAGSEVLKTTTADDKHKFEGVLHPKAGKALAAAGLTNIYAVRVDKSCLPVADPGDGALCSGPSPADITIGWEGTQGGPKEVKGKALVGKELSDELIVKMLDSRLSGGKAGHIPGGCKYAFPPARNTVDLSKCDPQQPVQSYHPLVVYTKDEFGDHASVGHLSDLHVNCRWQIVGKSPARVIEYPGGQHMDESPPVGPMLAETNRSVQGVMDAVFGSDAKVVVIGGDLIDHIRNAYDPGIFTRRVNRVKQVWDAVDLDSNYSDTSYPHGIDLVAFYSLVLNAINGSKKPCFGISGNHDCYVKPFGISPRVRSTRANEGIPEDLNLTFYEALLAFGPSGGLLKKMGSSFDADWFEWFYLVFTPFNDFWHKMPKQSLVGLGWGDDEVMLNPFAPGDQGRAHLPRSPEGVSSIQLGLLKDATKLASDHPVTLTTHFTFLSYHEPIPCLTGPAPDPWPPVSTVPTAGKLEETPKNAFEFGTFESNRSDVLGMLSNKQIACVLTGHSHRRGTYLLKPGSPQQSLMFDAGGDGVDVAKETKTWGAATAPIVVVSDSAGPYPRHNLMGEFVGYGSDRPGGTLVTYDSKGAVAKVTSLQANGRPKPRAVVALDYVDIVVSESGDGVFVGNSLTFTPVTAEQNSGAWGQDSEKPLWYIWVQMGGGVARWKISPTKLVFAYQDPVTSRWERVECSSSSVPGQFVVPVESTPTIRNWLTSQQKGFVSMGFMCADPGLNATYEWGDSWNFEVVPSSTMDSSSISEQTYVAYSVARPTHNKLATTATIMDTEFREVPDFAWREQTMSIKYG